MKTLICILCVCNLSILYASNTDIVGWRTDGSGIYTDVTPPTTWSADSNIRWKSKMPNWSNAQPILVGDKLFVNAEPNTLICVNAADGKILWQRANNYEDIMGDAEIAKLRKEIGDKAKPYREQLADVEKQMADLRQKMRETGDDSLRGKVRGLRLKQRELNQRINEADPLNLPVSHEDNGNSSAVPVSDGERIYVVYGNGVAACYDLDGKRQWAHLLEKPKHRWGHSASPVLSGDLVMTHIISLVAFDKKTGEERWRADSKEGWGSPIVLNIGGEDVVMTATDGDLFRARDGKKLGKIGGLKYATPLVQDGILYLIENDARALKIPTTMSDTLEFEKLWQVRIKGSRHYASSAINKGLIYAVSREGWLTVMDQKTGEQVYLQRLEFNGNNTNSVYPSVSIAAGNVFIGFEEGVTLVIKEGRTYEEVSQNKLEGYRSSLIFSGKTIYMRGLDHLYAIAAP